MQKTDVQVKIPIHETFQQTVQGEGFWSGVLVDFIRLNGCPVNCHFCDTGYSDKKARNPRSLVTIDKLLSELKSPRVVISGGEPTIQKDLLKLVKAIEDTNRSVSIETAGIKWHDFSSSTWITLSPKEHLNSEAVVDEHFWRRANEVKIVISDGTELEFYRRGNLLEKPWKHIYLQPEWENREVTTPKTLELLKQYPIAKLSVQTHKYINVL